VQYLLDHGADIEKSNQVGMTALHHAAKNGHANIVRILVQRGANYQKLTKDSINNCYNHTCNC
ncbi:hypothetical protein WUBG_16172, partial [Wuchereria bancrofti]